MFTYRHVRTYQELDDMYRLRYDIYCTERNFLAAEDFPDGRESDELDEHSVHFLALDTEQGGKVAGCARLILDNPHGLPVREHFSLNNWPRDARQAVEFSRLIVSPEYRSLRISREIILGLAQEASFYCSARGITHVYAVLETPLLKMLHMFKLPFMTVGDGEWYYNTYNMPVCLDLVGYNSGTPVTADEVLKYRNVGATALPMGVSSAAALAASMRASGVRATVLAD